MPQANQFNLKAVRDLATKSETAREYFEHLATLSNAASQTPVERAMDQIDASRSEIIDLFRKLEVLGLGKFKTGRRNHRSRFEWGVHRVELGKAAIGEIDQISALKEGDTDVDDLDGEKETWRFPLRPKTLIEVSLPRDLSAGEAQRLAEWIRTLAIA